MNFADNFDFLKPLKKCTSSLRVVTSKDSLNEQLFNNLPNMKNENKRTEKNEKEIISNEINNNETFAIQDTSSVFEVDDCVSLAQDSINPYQFSMLTSPDTQSIRKNSSYVSGHFVENFPDLDLSPIPNISPKNDNCQQSKIEFNDKESTHLKDNEKNHQKNSLKCEQMKNFSNSTQSVNCLEKSSDFYFSCRDFKSLLSDEIKSNGRKIKIPKLNLEEEGSEIQKTNTPDVLGSKIPIPSRKSNVFTKTESNEHFKKLELTRFDKNKENLRLRESEISLEKFVQLEISTGCCSASHLNQKSSKKT
ncbi:uncharacterized protein LOC122498353 [Leptopilina heterotoma]|uniref:uncharacterized protein LOC122498353 n=1 Tax=Leptopilina heterotoma TaxID=63436 RepID=UPI001CA84B27|nr:uncharacterized protein LOC122498353 [Leptopilina heterotoma]